MRIPVNQPYTVTTEFGVPDQYAKFGRHSGIDYAVPLNRPVYAPTSGTLTNVVSPTGGNMVVIFDGKYYHRLMHNQSFSRSNGRVNEGEEVAKAGTTGLSTGVHVHWDINTEGTYPTSFNSFINPNTWLQGGNMAKVSLGTARILAETILGRERNATHAGAFDADLNANHVNKELTNEYIMELWKSGEASNYVKTLDDLRAWNERGLNYQNNVIPAMEADKQAWVARATEAERVKDELNKSLEIKDKVIKDLEAKLAVQSDDTQLLEDASAASNVFIRLFNRIFKR